MNQTANRKMLTKLLFRLLPVQIMLAVVGAVNGIVSSYFATNFVSTEAMSAVGLYAPINMLITSISTVLVGGSSILCGKYMGRNQQDKMQNVFSLSLLLSLLVSAGFILALLLMGFFGLSGFLTHDQTVRPLFNRYLLGKSIEVLPLMLGSALAAFLTLENKGKRTLIASLAFFVSNVVFNCGMIMSIIASIFIDL